MINDYLFEMSNFEISPLFDMIDDCRFEMTARNFDIPLWKTLTIRQAV